MSEYSDEGREAFWDDQSSSDNPYEVGTDRWQSWNEGFSRTQADYYDYCAWDWATKAY